MQLKMIALLLQSKKLDINRRGTQGTTALIEATIHSNSDCVKLLLQRSDIDLEYRKLEQIVAGYRTEEYTALEIAAMKIDEINKKKYDEDLFPLTVADLQKKRQRYVHIIQQLVKHPRKQSEFKESKGEAAIHAAHS